MANKIILSADSTCDIGEDLKNKYNVNFYPFYIIIDENQYKDGIDITPDMLYSIYREKKVLPKTAAIGVGEYMNHFKKWVQDGFEVIHISLGSGLSSSYQNCVMASQELGGKVYPINSCSLSSGTGLLVIEAAKRIEKGLDAPTIQKEVSELAKKVEASFVLDTLEFLHAGGRCSSVAALGANLLKLKPCIEVSNLDGSMDVGKKYRGDLDKVLTKYVYDRLSDRDDIDDENIFITYSSISKDRIELVENEIMSLKKFKNIYKVNASCTISAHCGPNTLGILFLRK